MFQDKRMYSSIQRHLIWWIEKNKDNCGSKQTSSSGNNPLSESRVQNSFEQMLTLGRIRLVPVSPLAIQSVQVNFGSSSGRRSW